MKKEDLSKEDYSNSIEMYNTTIKFIKDYIDNNNDYPLTGVTIENVVQTDQSYSLSNNEIISIVKLVNKKFLKYIKGAGDIPELLSKA